MTSSDNWEPKMTGLVTNEQSLATLGARYSVCARHHRGAGRAVVTRRPDGAVDAGRKPDQMAPRPHELVLRDLPARTVAARDTRRSTPTTAYLFNSYYESLGAQASPAFARATVATEGDRGVAHYRASVDAAMHRSSSQGSPTPP